MTVTSQAVGFSVLEARARATFWLALFVTLGLTAGASLIDRGDWMAAARLGFVSRAYGHLRD